MLLTVTGSKAAAAAGASVAEAVSASAKSVTFFMVVPLFHSLTSGIDRSSMRLNQF
jgi:hypothetical protein